MSVFEETIQVIREDGVALPGMMLTPDFEPAEKCRGAGVVVVGGERGLGDAERTRLAGPLAEYGYFVVALDLVRGRPAASDADAAARAAGLDRSIAIDDIVAGILTLQQIASGKIGVIGVGIAGAIAIEAATMVPRIDGVVHVDGPPPSRAVRVTRLRAPVQIHRASRGNLFSAEDFADLQERSTRAKVRYLFEEYDADDGFFTRPRDDNEALQGRIAWDRMRDFLSYALI